MMHKPCRWHRRNQASSNGPAAHAFLLLPASLLPYTHMSAAHVQVRLAISHALAQSTKLSVYEERVVALVEESKHLPQVRGQSAFCVCSRHAFINLFSSLCQLVMVAFVRCTPKFAHTRAGRCVRRLRVRAQQEAALSPATTTPYANAHAANTHPMQDLASQGRVSMSTKKLAQLIGKVFLQSSTLNLLSTVMDTPEFFWSAPDQLQVGAMGVVGCGATVGVCSGCGAGCRQVSLIRYRTNRSSKRKDAVMSTTWQDRVCSPGFSRTVNGAPDTAGEASQECGMSGRVVTVADSDALGYLAEKG